MENFFFSSSPEEGRLPGRESSATEGLSKKQKKKQKKRENAAAAALLATTSRPGKKKLRKLRYQQEHVSPTDFLLLSTKACKFTQSVAETGLETTTTTTRTTTIHPADNVDTQPPPSVLPVGAQVQVITSCMTPTNIDAFPRVKESSSSSFVPQRRIHVQPLLVLDLNGILCHRLRPHHLGSNIPRTAYRQVIAHIAGTPVVPRTDLVDLLTFLDQHFCLAVWTSAKNKTATGLVQALIPPLIAQRLLFVWAQHHCDVMKDGEEDNHEIEPVFEKNLNKVWKEFPLWNAHTTILMDDSPEKCQRWHENAIHPPSLHGIKESELEAMGTQELQSDEENVRLQREFFEGLVQRLHEEFVVTQWTVTPSCSSTEPNEKEETENEPYKVTCAPILLDHLRTNAVGHMGWR